MKCPHCLNLFHEQFQNQHIGSAGNEHWNAQFQVCPGCKKPVVFLHAVVANKGVSHHFLAYPKGITRMPIPPEVDDLQVVNDYTEAALVLDDSPKASAALSRRCLQHILREKAGVKKGDLFREIQQILDSNTLPSDIAENLDAVRNIGNFAAHPVKTTSTGEIVDVEPHEAEWNLEVLEQLIDFYYVRPAIAKKKRDELNAKLTATGKPPLK